MYAKTCLRSEKGRASDYERVVRRLRLAAADQDQSEDRRQWIRAGTQC